LIIWILDFRACFGFRASYFEFLGPFVQYFQIKIGKPPTGSSAHPEPVFVAQVKGEDGGGLSRLVKVVNPGEGFIASNGLGVRASMARC
jgi:hypothetical protein